jgi:hypothetical protein
MAVFIGSIVQVILKDVYTAKGCRMMIFDITQTTLLDMIRFGVSKTDVKAQW